MMLTTGCFNLEAVVLKALVDLIDVGLTGPDEADVKRLGIAHRIGASDADQGEHEAVVIFEHVEVLVALAEWTQAKVALEEPTRRGDVVNREMEIVELHRRSAADQASNGTHQLVRLLRPLGRRAVDAITDVIV